MQCIQPPPLTSDQLSAALDGQPDLEISNHLAQCPHCAARLQAAAHIERSLTGALHRWDCPTPAQLGDYHLGGLPETETAAITRHLAGCVRCSAELSALRVFLATESAPLAAGFESAPHANRPGLGEVIARLLPLAPAPAVRGETREPIMAEAAGVTIILDVQPAEAGRVAILGQVAAEEQDKWNGALVLVHQSGELQATAAVDDLGGFQCVASSAAPMELRLTPVGGRTVVVRDVRIAD